MDSGKSELQENSPRGGPIDTEHRNNSTFSPAPLEEGGIPVMNADLQAEVEENAFQTLTGEPLAKRTCFTFSNESLIMEKNEFFYLTFPIKLWKIVQSDRFKSIWWNEDGTSIVIDEEKFKEEILEKKNPIRIFETDSMNSFIRQLNLYGFSKVRQDSERSASLDDFLVEEKETLPSKKLQVYCNPNFKRGSPHLVLRLKRRLGVKNTANSLFLPSQNKSKNFLKVGHQKPEDQKSALTSKSAKKCSAPSSSVSSSSAAAASASSFSFSSSPSSTTPATTSASASASSTTSSLSSSTSREKGPKSVESNHVRAQPSASSPASGGSFSASPLLVGGAPHARLNQSIPSYLAPLVGPPQLNMHSADGFASLYHAIQNGSFQSVAYPAVYSERTAIQAHLASLLPFCGPCYSVSMMAAASATLMSMSSEQQQSSQYQHCPLCNCSSSNNVQSPRGDPSCN
ncbi:heat shock transcription factor, Y-linked-like [Petaurus breviceps papuanus]|uniref:heat shock transcription factor, Y-linked-like n=1 Tax=Petaurus breviceps papuanus TaxID=3040969 RepID=UPI0036D8ACFA